MERQQFSLPQTIETPKGMAARWHTDAEIAIYYDQDQREITTINFKTGKKSTDRLYGRALQCYSGMFNSFSIEPCDTCPLKEKSVCGGGKRGRPTHGDRLDSDFEN